MHVQDRCELIIQNYMLHLPKLQVNNLFMSTQSISANVCDEKLI